MKIEHFMLLSKADQIQMLYGWGTKISERAFSGNRFYLYDIDGFYVELLHSFSEVNMSAVTVFRVFDNTDYLEIYLRKIDLSDLAEILNS